MPTRVELPDGVPPLKTFYAYLSGGCNLACRHCWINPTFEKPGSSGQCLDEKLYTQAIEEALPLGLDSMKFTGGEPLLHPEFVRLAEIATHNGIKTWMETNGTLITRDLAFHLKKKTSLFQISVSLDGATESTHDNIRNVPGSFAAAVKGIEYLAEAGYKPQIIMSLFPKNLEEVESLIQLAVERGCNSVKFNIVQPSGRSEKLEDKAELIPLHIILENGRKIEKELQAKYNISLLFGWPIAFQSIGNINKGPSGSCNIFSILGILPSGQMAMCGIGTQEKDLIYGMIGKDKIVDVWTNNLVLKSIRSEVPEHLQGVCNACLFKKHCLGSCIALNYHRSRSITAPYWFCDEASNKGLFPLSRKNQIT